jgi:hypothetical protein
VAGLSEKTPRVIALIDLPDLQWQAKRIGSPLGHDLAGVVERVEAGVAGLDPALETRLRLGVVYVYSPVEPGRPEESGRVIFRQRATEIKRPCWSCYRQCTHCQASTTDRGRQGPADPIAKDLLELARKDEFDWAVVLSIDLRLIPVVRHLQSHGRAVIHACFPPIAMDLTKACRASIDLRAGWGGGDGRNGGTVAGAVTRTSP